MEPKSSWEAWHIILDETIITQFWHRHAFKFQNLSSNTNISEIGRRAALYVSMIFSRTKINEFWCIPLLFFALVNSLAFSTSAAAFFRSTFSFFSNISSVYSIQGAKHSEWEKKVSSNCKLLKKTTNKLCAHWSLHDLRMLRKTRQSYRTEKIQSFIIEHKIE